MTTNYLWRVVNRVAYEAGVRPVPCTCATRRQDRHVRGCPRTMSGENRSSISPHTLRRTFGAISSTVGFVSDSQQASLRCQHHDHGTCLRTTACADDPQESLFEAFAHTLRPIGRGEEFHAAGGPQTARARASGRPTKPARDRVLDPAPCARTSDRAGRRISGRSKDPTRMSPIADVCERTCANRIGDPVNGWSRTVLRHRSRVAVVSRVA